MRLEQQNQLTLKASRTKTTLFTPHPAEHNTYTTNQQHHTTHKQRARNPRTHTRPETNLLKTHTKQNTKS